MRFYARIFTLILITAVFLTPAEQNQRKVYSIVGESKNLSKKRWRSMKRWRQSVIKFGQKYPQTVYLNGATQKKMVSLTFDDGPDALITPQILDVLAKYNVKAAFFFVGSKLDDNKKVVERADREGQVILSHAWHHKQLTLASDQNILQELLLTENKLFDLIGKKPALMRPPYGEIDHRVVKQLQVHGYKIVLWSLDTLDWSQMDKENIVKNVVDHVRAGDIILMHSDDDKQATLEALPQIIEQLQNRGFKLVDVGTLLECAFYKNI